MSHLVESMAYVGDVPWHGLGHAVSNDISIEEMQKRCGADFEVLKEKEFVEYNGRRIPTGNYALLRKNAGSDYVQVLDSVSEDWKFPQPKESFDFFQEWVEDGNMEMHTAGVLDEGRMIWCLAKVKESFSLFKGKDVVESHLLFSTPYRYGKATIVMATPIRVVCNNTLQLALSNGKQDMMIRVNHRRDFDSEQVKTALKLNRGKVATYKEAAEFLSSKKAKPAEVQEFFDKIFPLTSNKKNKDHSRNSTMLMDILETQPGAELGEGTWWSAFNAVTYATDHLIGNNDNTRLMSAFYGVGRNRKVDALKLATQFAKAA